MNLNWARKAAPGRAVTPALLFGLVLLFPIAALSHPGTLAVSPPMGWNSWDAYGFTLDETAFRNNATVLGKYRRYGWRYAIIDEGWYMANPLGTDRQSRDYQMDEHGRLVPAANRFPSASGGTGLTALADWSHHLGLQLGIHIVRGIPKAAVELNRQIAGSQFHVVDAADTADTCPWDDGNYGVRDNAAGQAYYDSLIKQYAAWKIDFLKVDCISNLPYRAAEIRQIATAIRHAGRPMVLSLSPGPTDITHAREVARYSQMWRISNDIWDGWSFDGAFPIGISAAFDKLALWHAHARPGQWPDADMLPWGMLGPHPGWGEARRSRLTPDEQRSQFLLWAIARSPLILGCNLTELDETTGALITNSRLIDLNQGAWQSHPAKLLSAPLENIRMWVAVPTAGKSGDRIVALFNVGSEPVNLQASWRALNIEPPRLRMVDVTTGAASNDIAKLNVMLAPHASVAYRLH